MDNLFAYYSGYTSIKSKPVPIWKTLGLILIVGITFLLGLVVFVIALIQGKSPSEFYSKAPTLSISSIVCAILLIPLVIVLVTEIKDRKEAKNYYPVHAYIEHEAGDEEIEICMYQEKNTLILLGTKEYRVRMDSIRKQEEKYIRLDFVLEEKEYYVLLSKEDVRNSGISL